MVFGPAYHKNVSMLVILTPFYNAHEYLARCVGSIRGQRSDDWHCYLIDDVSTDGSYELARGLVGSVSRFELIRPPQTRQWTSCGDTIIMSGT